MKQDKSSLLSEIESSIKGIFSDRVKLSNYSEFVPSIRRAVQDKDMLARCVEEYGTPLYVLDEGHLIEMAKKISLAFRKHLKRVSLFYAFKSNDLPYLVSRLKDNGINADVSSMFELELALKLGFKKIIYTAPCKSDEELKLALNHSDKVVLNVDNLDELGRVADMVAWRQPTHRMKISLRINPRATLGGWSKFGLSLDDMRIAAGLIMDNRLLKWAGIHFHSSWNQTPDAHVESIRAIGKYLRANFNVAELSNLEFIDIGGGFLPEGTGALFSATTRGEIIEKTVKHHGKIPELREVHKEKYVDIRIFAQKISKALKKEIFEPLGRDDLEVWLEPGRYISSNSTCILLKVCYAKKGRVMVDGGINLTGSANFEFEFFPVVNISRPSLKRKKATIYGPLCDPEDHWGYSYFGDTCRKGDILAVMNQGAYTFSTAWRWQRPTAAYLAYSGNRILVAKQAETFSNRYAGCRF